MAETKDVVNPEVAERPAVLPKPAPAPSAKSVTAQPTTKTAPVVASPPPSSSRVQPPSSMDAEIAKTATWIPSDVLENFIAAHRRAPEAVRAYLKQMLQH